DNNWTLVNNNEYVRVTFEKNLTNKNDITIYPRIVEGNPKIEVYEKGGTEKIAEFTSINNNEYNKIFLTNLGQGQCYDNETEILTENGWKLFRELGDEKVATLNQSTHELEWQNPIDKQVFEHNGEMYRIETIDRFNNVGELAVSPKHKIYGKIQNNSESFESSKIDISDCFLSSLSSEIIVAFNSSANERKSASLGWFGSKDSAFGKCFEYFENGTNVTTFFNLVLNSSNSSEVSLVFTSISDLCLSNSFSENSGEYSSCSANNNFFTNEPFQKKEYNLLVSNTSFIYNKPLDFSSSSLCCLANSPNCKASSLVNSLLSNFDSRKSINSSLCNNLRADLLNTKDQSISGCDSICDFNSFGKGIFNSSILDIQDKDYLNFSIDDFSLYPITKVYEQINQGKEIYFLDENNQPVKINSIEKIPYNDKIYGVDVSNDVVLVRRKNGTALWSGNSESYSQNIFDLKVLGSVEFDYIVDPVNISSFSIQPHDRLFITKDRGLEKYVVEDKTWSFNGSDFNINLTINLTVWNFMKDAVANPTLPKCRIAEPYIKEDYPNFDCNNAVHRNLLLSKLQNFTSKGFKVIKQGVNRGYVNITGNKIVINIPKSILTNNDLIELGENSLTYVYQNITTVSYDYTNFQINATLERCDENRTNCGTGYPDLLIIDSSKLKFGAVDTNRTKNENYRYTWQSTREIKQDILGYYIDGNTTTNKFTKTTERIDINTNDICSSITNSSNISIIDFNPNCTYSSYSTNNLYFLEVNFTGRWNSTTNNITIDPSYSITKIERTEAIDTNVTQENNYTHLEINNNTAPYNNLVLYMPFDENFTRYSNKTFDYTDSNNDGTATNFNGTAGYGFNASSCLTGYGGCVSFDGTDDYVETSDISQADGGTSLTVSAWIYQNSLVANKAVIAKWDFQTEGSWEMEQSDGAAGRIQVFIASSLTDNGGNSGRTPQGTITAGIWHHVVFVYDGSQTGNSDRLKIYINGTNRSIEFAGTIPASMTNSAATVKIGKFGGTVDRYWNGLIDEVMIFNISLNASEITKIYNNQSARFKAGGTQELKNFNISLTNENRANVTAEFDRNFSSNVSLRLG
ncbi:MAG: LamG-like jellyroll fold domain-containing protein, partial [Nanoarchaeota archaeon]